MSTMVIRKIDNLILKELQEIPYNSKREILTYIKTMKARTSENTVAALNKTSGLWKGLVDSDRLKKKFIQIDLSQQGQRQLLKYLLDTDWIIDHLNGKREITSMIKSLAKDGIAVSIVSVAELFEGVYGSKDYEKSLEALESFLKGFQVINLDVETCNIFGRERNKLRKIGKIIGDFDLLIGSLCLRHNLVLLTNNKAHFDRIEGLNIISLERQASHQEMS